MLQILAYPACICLHTAQVGLHGLQITQHLLAHGLAYLVRRYQIGVQSLALRGVAQTHGQLKVVRQVDAVVRKKGPAFGVLLIGVVGAVAIELGARELLITRPGVERKCREGRKHCRKLRRRKAGWEKRRQTGGESRRPGRQVGRSSLQRGRGGAQLGEAGAHSRRCAGGDRIGVETVAHAKFQHVGVIQFLVGIERAYEPIHRAGFSVDTDFLSQGPEAGYGFSVRTLTDIDHGEIDVHSAFGKPVPVGGNAGNTAHRGVGVDLD